MLCDLSDIKIIRSQMRYNRNLETRKKGLCQDNCVKLFWGISWGWFMT